MTDNLDHIYHPSLAKAIDLKHETDQLLAELKAMIAPQPHTPADDPEIMQTLVNELQVNPKILATILGPKLTESPEELAALLKFIGSRLGDTEQAGMYYRLGKATVGSLANRGRMRDYLEGI